MQEGSGNGRRLSFKQPSPNLSNVGSFMPVNTNSKVNQTGSPYSFQPMSNSQSSLTTMNGSTNADAANAALVAAGAMSGMLPQMTVPQPTSMGFASVDGGGKSGEHGQLDNAFGALSPLPVEGHTEGVGGNNNVPGNHSHHGSPSVGSSGNPNPKPQVGTEEWHRVRRDNHKEGTSPSISRNLYIHSITRVVCPLQCWLLTDSSKIQLSGVAERPSTKALTNWPKLFLVARRTRAPSFSAPFNTYNN